ncbi:MAG: NADH-quinone oxidoreductase subunit N [Archangium gephyra]|uniref:NADH-quinone oxidoreductase subunit N n=1 Tax=Archangium gephyra TaxID=48 RepID=A0A2W5U460_9BACT|nr:MAG: NADH-quinone oxidoreductase subunit N [Archangium gephyra]
MNIPNFTFSEFFPVLPAGVLLLGGVVLMLSEVFLTTAQRTYQAILAAFITAVAGSVAFNNAFEPARLALQGYVVLDPFSQWTTVLVCLGTFLAVFLSSGFLKHRNAERGEFYALLLFAAAGMSLLSMSAEFISLFINLEVMSVATYALTAFLRRGPRPSEAGFKYFILGAFAAALLLYGAALLYGATGATKLIEIGAALPSAFASQPGLVYAGIGLVLVGFAFKIAAVPFHMWTPDVYEGAPTPVTALMSAGVKAAAFVALVRVFLFLVKGIDPQIPFAVFSTLALLTMVGGNLMALPQRNVKRMLAYSSIAHAGYMLLGVAALFAPKAVDASAKVGLLTSTPLTGMMPDVAPLVFKGLLFYVLGYTVTSLGAFGTIAALERREDETRGNTWDLERFAGLAQRQPGWALAMAAFMLSLGGVPPTVGFLGKLFLFSAAVDAGLLGLAVVGILSSVAGVYFYLRVVVYMFMRPAPADAPAPFRHWTTEFALVASSIAVVAFGVIPGPVTEWFSRAGMVFGN